MIVHPSDRAITAANSDRNGKSLVALGVALLSIGIMSGVWPRWVIVGGVRHSCGAVGGDGRVRPPSVVC
jgi:hypothetical protein